MAVYSNLDFALALTFNLIKLNNRVSNDFSRSTRLAVISNNQWKGLFTKPLRSKLILFHKLSRNYKQRHCNIFVQYTGIEYTYGYIEMYILLHLIFAEFLQEYIYEIY